MLQAIADTHDLHHIERERHATSAIAPTMADGKRHLLLAATGSVAAIKLPEIIRLLGQRYPPSELSIRVVLSESAKRFLAGQSREQPTIWSVSHLPCVDAVYDDAAEWSPAWRRGEPILHIQLRKWADVLAVVPLSMNALARFAGGMADDLLSSVVRAWDTDGSVDGLPGDRTRGPKRIVVAPAANSAMWKHPVTKKNLQVLEEEWGVKEGGGGGWFEVLRPQEDKLLACGDVGVGAMRDWREIVEIIEERLDLKMA